MSLSKILGDLKKGSVAPCYLLYGEEEYLLNDALQQILDLLIVPADRDFNLFHLDGENTDLDSLIEYVSTPSLLGGRKVVVVRNTNIFASQVNLAEMIENIRGNLDNHPEKAIKYFFSFMQRSGFKWEDIQGEGWKKISDDQWREVVAGDAGNDRDKWLPRIIDITASTGIVPESRPDKADQFDRLFADGFSSGNCIIFTAESVDKRKKIYKIVDEAGITLHFGEIKKESALRETCKNEAQALLASCGKHLTPKAWTALGKKTGFQLRSTLNELQKLIFFTGAQSSIEEKDVDEVVGKTREEKMFELTNALSEKNHVGALNSLKFLLDQGVYPLPVLGTISKTIRLLLQSHILIDSGKLPGLSSKMEYGWFQKKIYPLLNQLVQTKVWPENALVQEKPFVIFNALRNCKRFSYPVLISFLDDLLAIDRAMKSSAVEPRILLEYFVMKVCTKAS